MKKFLSAIDGYKTYIGMIAAGAVLAAEKLGWIPADTVQWLLIGIGAWTGIAITHKGNKIVKAASKISETGGGGS